MKKISLVLLSSAFLLTACSEGEFKEQSEKVFKESLVSKEVLKHEISKENTEMEKFLLDSLGIENTEITVEDSELYKEFNDKIKSVKEKSKLTLDSIEFNSDRTEAKAIIDVSFYDLGQTIANSIEHSLDSSLVKLYSGEKISELDFYNNTLEAILENDFSNSKQKTLESIKVELKKENGEWKVNNPNENKDLMKALTLNFAPAKEKILDVKLTEVKKNVEFSLIESNLREIHSSVSNKMKENAGDFYTLNFAELKAAFQEKLSLDISFYDEEKKDYHVGFDKDKNELFVQYSKDTELMKLSLPVE